MHELSIARSIVELVEEQADNRGASVVEELELEIGHLSGVEIQTLEFALDSAIKGSKLEKAQEQSKTQHKEQERGEKVKTRERSVER